MEAEKSEIWFDDKQIANGATKGGRPSKTLSTYWVEEKTASRMTVDKDW